MSSENTIELNSNKVDAFSFWWYFSLLAQKPLLSAQMVLASLFVQVFALGMPIFYMIIFDRVFGRQNLNTLDVIAVGMLLIMVCDLIVKTIRSFSLSQMLDEIDKNFVDIFLEKFFLIKSTEKGLIKGYTESFGEMFRVNQAVIGSILITSMDVIFSLFVLAILFALNVKLALVTVAPLVPLAVIVFIKMPQFKKRAIISSVNQRKNMLKLSEISDNTQCIVSLNCAKEIGEKFSADSKKYIESEFISRFDRIFSQADMSFIMNIGSFAILYFGAHEVLGGEITFGVYLAISIMGRNFLSGFQKLLTSIQQMQEMMPSLRKLGDIWSKINLDTEEQGLSLPECKGNIRLIGINYRYHQDLPDVLNNFSLEIPAGSKVVITGKSGAGKTTLINLILKLISPQSGYISLDGVNLANLSDENLRSNIGVVLQNSQVFSGTVLENIKIAQPKATVEDVLRVASFVKMDDFLIRNPKGLNAEIYPKGINLTTTQLAQISLARALLRDPRIIVIDSAWDLVDQALQEIIYDRLLEKYKKSTCIFVSNNLLLHKKVDIINVMHAGQVVEIGNYESLTKANGYYYHMYSQSINVG